MELQKSDTRDEDLPHARKALELPVLVRLVIWFSYIILENYHISEAIRNDASIMRKHINCI